MSVMSAHERACTRTYTHTHLHVHALTHLHARIHTHTYSSAVSLPITPTLQELTEESTTSCFTRTNSIYNFTNFSIACFKGPFNELKNNNKLCLVGFASKTYVCYKCNCLRSVSTSRLKKNNECKFLFTIFLHSHCPFQSQNRSFPTC